MNEIERVMKFYEYELQIRKELIGGLAGAEHDLRRLEVIVEALHEKLERENGCAFCTGKRKYFSNLGFESTIKIASSFQGKLFLSVNGHRVEIYHCPKCGRRLEDKP